MSVGLKGNADGSGAIQVGGTDAITITTSLNTTFVGTATVPTGTLYPIVTGTSVASTSGTSIDFTSLPSWVKRVTIMFYGMSTSGTSNKLIQLIYGGSTVVSAGYRSSSARFANAVVAENSSTAGFLINTIVAADDHYGSYVFTNPSGNNWVGSGGMTYAGGTLTSSGGIALSGVLTGVRITTVNGTDTFDAGSINILYE
jgi:hypothetical protein